MTKFAPVEPLFRTDAYKLDHRRVYELSGDVTQVYSNFTNRGSRMPDVSKVVHFGLQAYIQELVESYEPFFAADEDEVATLYEERVTSIVGPNQIGSDHIRGLHRLGYLPLKFAAVPEGTEVPLRVPSFTVENTHPDFYWLTNYIETDMSASVWQASTTATIAHRFRKLLERSAERTGGAPEAVDFQGHDFSYRGMSSAQTAAASGAGHLLSFSGTDSLVSLEWIDKYYGGEYAAMSVPATEHSVMCAGIATLGEQELFDKILDLYPAGIVSVVSDTFDLWQVLTEFLPNLKEKILARDGKLVIRPDSGDPVDILTGTLKFPEDKLQWGDTPETDTRNAEERGVVELLWDTFGGTTNDKGFMELDSHIGVIYGDSINYERAQAIIERLEAKGFASTNVVFGVGSFQYQYNTRDTFMSAIKATWAVIDGKPVNLKKDPATDSGTKKSATGRLAVLQDEDGELFMIQEAEPVHEMFSLMQPIWEDGEFITRQTFAEVREVLNGTA